MLSSTFLLLLIQNQNANLLFPQSVNDEVSLARADDLQFDYFFMARLIDESLDLIGRDC